MKLVNFLTEKRGTVRAGVVLDEIVLDLKLAWTNFGKKGGASMPLDSVESYTMLSPEQKNMLHAIVNKMADLDLMDINQVMDDELAYPLNYVKLVAPVRKPGALRDFFAFERHVKMAFGLNNRKVPAEWYQFPVFYFSNPGSIQAPNAVIVRPANSSQLDYELEIACVIGKEGRNITSERAEEYIAGYTIFNDWSARDLQRVETRVGQGPAKGKDFASSLGPWLVTPDELEERKTDRKTVFDLEMRAYLNGGLRSQANMRELYYSFAEMIVHASKNATLYPGDVLASGTCGSGCLLELTGGQGPWLQEGDEVVLEIDGLGQLRNRIGAAG